MQYLLKFKTLIGYFIELNWPRVILNWIYYWIELAKNNFELNIFLNWILVFFLIEYFFWIESWQFSFELKIELNHFRQFSFESKIELNHFQAKFNHWLNRQIVPPMASQGRGGTESGLSLQSGGGACESLKVDWRGIVRLHA